MKKRTLFSALAIGCLVLSGCASKKDLENCQNENRQLTSEYQSAKETIAANNARIKSLEDQLAQAKASAVKPFEPTHPGEVLKDEIDCRGISQRQLAHEIGVSSSLLNEVLNGERALNTQLALLLSAALDIDAEPLLRLQAKYDMLTGHKTPSFIQRLNM